MTSGITYRNCTLATLDEGKADYGLIESAALVVRGGQIDWIGPQADLPSTYNNIESYDLGGRLVTPALIDCHTHLVFAGNRVKEFEMRLSGKSYEEIARAGGGILSTVKATRGVSFEQLVEQSLSRLDDLLSEGVCAVEIKSGYGLTIADELRMLKAARHLETLRPVKIMTTYLAAHAVPPEYKGKADQYIDEVVIPGLRQGHAEGLIDAVDGFCENIGFSAAQIARIFDVAKELGLPVKLHAEQLSDQKGALLCAQYGGLSADHLEYLPREDVKVFARSGAVAVLLPGAFYTLKETQLPPIDAMREQGLAMAVATDCNPGTSPISSLLTVMNMACREFGLTPSEALAGVTRHAAKALGIDQDYGTLNVGKQAELAVWDVKHPAQLSYWLGANPLYKRIHKGLIHDV